MYQNVSESDLKECLPNYNELSDETLNAVLYFLGIDVSKGVECNVIQHRNKKNKIVKCKRWVGYERRDKEWLSSRNASWEVKLFLSDPELRRDLILMQQDSIEATARYREWLEENKD